MRRIQWVLFVRSTAMVVTIIAFLVWVFQAEHLVSWTDAHNLLTVPILVLGIIGLTAVPTRSVFARVILGIVAVGAGFGLHVWYVEVLPNANWGNAVLAGLGPFLLGAATSAMTMFFRYVWSLEDHWFNRPVPPSGGGLEN